ncbi:MAG: hypothetical protein A2504_17765 [Bdellovibrionales bacterium RIFOXYD12_FULL_39_22]|nr:MAG: hypothetical protein A2385_15465 [Bdellovibrionales bacterium RIFOXYB1_FULL_39_21]OFZ40594.1 MAG: hypothetical protein A2485_03300 [Bdellovibrionales bacterium RIFOXYC12_FULL_39_17]OFZ50458.1 MAG: hypothetical protein A2404_02765 [Bdellovibrionales bacterium RIFOXYC1_FULL_39_130]OFZ72668.1 MAG: hypothetical protein A2451_09835 [Bdellovibrionales bacterium RIFOXYC2_FULL_39_8]OFZ77717.1 MAG: hypothetical protein A2560_05135 [Bdellovibrionales bacterium RIFOXYD1_FULL_39_84]OFZ91751.1 MAG:
MDLQMVFMVALALSMDAFAVSISCGIKLRDVFLSKYFKIAATFGLFQAGMPLLGWYAGTFVRAVVEPISLWITFAVFLVLAIKTLRDAISPHGQMCDTTRCFCTSWRCLLSLAVATSIDAMMIGVVFAINGTSIGLPVIVIGLVTLAMTVVGAFIGNRAGHLMGRWASGLAGIILLGLAVKVLF